MCVITDGVVNGGDVGFLARRSTLWAYDTTRSVRIGSSNAAVGDNRCAVRDLHFLLASIMLDRRQEV
ncbi:hypothetical protein GCM10027184_52730 [Saccharothrix stipae]